MDGKFFSQTDFFTRANRIVLQFLTRYARDQHKQLVIVPCMAHYNDGNRTLEKEKDYYLRLLGEPCTFSDWRSLRSGYDAIDSAEVVVTIDSTLGYESAARSNKTAIFPIRSTLLDLPDRVFGWPNNYPANGPFWTHNTDPAEFTQIMDHLFAIDDARWRTELSECHFDAIMASDPGNAVLRSVLGAVLGTPNA